ncbi:hypothetical protein BLNAU_5685 [Blattamonas nauphoetae]|uniref:Dynamin family protein n=1 Tax=Blattamonas nauphoetae TaxID=2049346 RepID=A0ABQ9Y6M0_9EUKA|nr:hypothetical protein BLNAU_5685 [Blattamonas nauphoetae]
MQADVRMESKQAGHEQIIDGLKRIYRETIRPFEQMAHFEQFHSVPWRDSDFDANPMILLCGQYSVGKTSFIEFLLGRGYPGQLIGPEPTTDKFVAVYHGEQDAQIPGNAAAMQSNLPFQTLERFGANFLNRFQVSMCNSDFLRRVTLIDSPGVLSGEQQRLGRAYDFTAVVEWFAQSADMILLLFDANKLDISDEFRGVIDVLKGQEDKTRVILNKADGLSTQNLMRVYGALMWSLSRAFKTPEVVRVYCGSFWNQPLKSTDNENLFKTEMADLFHDLGQLPKANAQRRVNELVKRTKLCRAIAALTSYLKDTIPVFSKEKKKAETIANLGNIYQNLAAQYGFSVNDFPAVSAMQKRLQRLDWSAFNKIPLEQFQRVTNVLSTILPQHLQLLQNEQTTEYLNPFDLAAKYGTKWSIDEKEETRYRDTFLKRAGFDPNKPNFGAPYGTNALDAKLDGDSLYAFFQKTGIPPEGLKELWRMSDLDRDSKLSYPEFAIALHLLKLARDNKGQLPLSLPPEFVAMINRQFKTKTSEGQTAPQPPPAQMAPPPVPSHQPPTAPNRPPPQPYQAPPVNPNPPSQIPSKPDEDDDLPLEATSY